MSKNALKLTDIDNVATALDDIAAGDQVVISDSDGVQIDEIKSLSSIIRGHKIALIDIPAGGHIVKYGYHIGVATKDIVRGEHVHTHNLSSERGRGDL